MTRPTRNYVPPAKQMGEPVPQLPSDIAASLVVEWRDEPITRTAFARIEHLGVVLRAGEQVWSVDECNPAGVVGREVAAGHLRGHDANKRAAVLALASHLAQQFARAVDVVGSAAGAETVEVAPCTCRGKPNRCARCVDDARRLGLTHDSLGRPLIDPRTMKPVEAAPVFEWRGEHADRFIVEDPARSGHCLMAVEDYGPREDWRWWATTSGNNFWSERGTASTLDEAKRAAEAAYLAMVHR